VAVAAQESTAPRRDFEFEASNPGGQAYLGNLGLRWSCAMPRSYILLALPGGFAMSHANAQPPLSEDVLRPILQELLIKRYEDLAYIFPSNAKTSLQLDVLFIGEPEKYISEKHHNLDMMADPELPIYPVKVQFTVFDLSGRAERKEKDYYCFITYQRDWGCSPWSLEERDIP
jgi:hypothetical protein